MPFSCEPFSPIRHIFHRFQNVPASCERCLNLPFYDLLLGRFLQCICTVLKVVRLEERQTVPQQDMYIDKRMEVSEISNSVNGRLVRYNFAKIQSCKCTMQMGIKSESSTNGIHTKQIKK